MKKKQQEPAANATRDGSAAQGGDLGWSVPGMFVPEFDAVLDRLKDREISQPVVSRFGVHLIQLIERRRVELSLAQQREQMRNTLKAARAEEAYATSIAFMAATSAPPKLAPEGRLSRES